MSFIDDHENEIAEAMNVYSEMSARQKHALFQSDALPTENAPHVIDDEPMYRAIYRQLQRPLPPSALQHAEAPCSTNAYVEIAGVKHQITARGNTAVEMAHNYFAAIDALTTRYDMQAQETRTSLTERVGKQLAICLTKAGADIAKIERWGYAAALVLRGSVYVHPDNASLYCVWDIREVEDYYVTPEYLCACTPSNVVGACVHAQALWLAQKCGGIAEEAPAVDAADIGGV